MAELKEQRKEYYIPDNYAEEGRILQGMIKIRNLIEAVILAVIFAIPGFLIISNMDSAVQSKISIMIIFCLPPLILGITGFNGDSLFYTAKCAKLWKDEKSTMLFNHKPVLLKEDPVEAAINETRKLDVWIDKYETGRKEKIDRKTNINLREGVDFEFADDDSIKKYLKKNSQKNAGKQLIQEEQIDEELFEETELDYQEIDLDEELF